MARQIRIPSGFRFTQRLMADAVSPVSLRLILWNNRPNRFRTFCEGAKMALFRFPRFSKYAGRSNHDIHAVRYHGFLFAMVMKNKTTDDAAGALKQKG